MAGGTFSREDFESMQNELARMYENQKKITSSISEYYKQLKKIGDLQRNLNNLNNSLVNSKKNIKEIESEIFSKLRNRHNLSAREKSLLTKELKELRKKLNTEREITNELGYQKKILETNIESEQEHVNILNARKALGNTILGQMKKTGRYLVSQTGYLLDQQKALKTAELSMGVLSNQSGMFRKDIIKASHTTNLLGVDTKKLAEIQASYSDQVGRAVVLSKENLEAMAELSTGTMLGVEGATEMASQMEVFGKSAKSTAVFVEDILDSSNKIGLNSNKVLSNINKGLKSMNRLSFKGGTKALAEMAKNAAKLGFEMSSIEGVADKLFNPEGAVEMAAQLQVLGGEWSKLADPFTLMYQARNAPEELAKSLYEAAGASAHFNEKTGEIEVAAMELHRLKEVAKATGLNYEELAVSAKKFAKLSRIKTQITGNFDEDIMEFITNTADMDKNGNFNIQLENENGEVIAKNLQELNRLSKEEVQRNIKRVMDEKKSLKDRALDAQTFDETFRNIVNQFKSILLPAFEGLAKGLESGLRKFTEWDEKSGFTKKLAEMSRSIGKLLGEDPFKSLMVGLAAYGLFKAAQWFSNGVSLGLGFKSVTSGLFGPNGGASSSIKGPGGGLFGKMGKGQSFGKNLRAGGRSFGSIGGGVLAAGISGYDEWTTNSENGMGVGENVGRTAIRGGGAGLGAWGGASLGAAIGTAILPGIGTIIGGLLGGLGGGLLGDKLGDKAGDAIMQDFVMRPGQDAVPFTSKDTLVGLKDGGPIEKSFGKMESKSNDGKMNISFSPIKIDFGILTLKSGDSSINLDLEKDPVLAREISRIVQENIRKAIGGGKLNPNVI